MILIEKTFVIGVNGNIVHMSLMRGTGRAWSVESQTRPRDAQSYPEGMFYIFSCVDVQGCKRNVLCFFLCCKN